MPEGISRLPELPRDEALTLREFTLECRRLVPSVMRMLGDLIEHKDELTAVEQMALTTLVLDRAYGRPRQVIQQVNVEQGDHPVRLYIPSNGRDTAPVEDDGGSEA